MNSTDSNDFDRDPCNATCVVGPRVYSRQPDLNVSVIWPGTNALTTDEAESRPILDREDPAKAAFDQATTAADKDEATEKALNNEDDNQHTAQHTKEESTDDAEAYVYRTRSNSQAIPTEAEDKMRLEHNNDDNKSLNMPPDPLSPPVPTPSTDSADHDTDADADEIHLSIQRSINHHTQDQYDFKHKVQATTVPEPPLPAIDHSRSQSIEWTSDSFLSSQYGSLGKGEYI